MRHIILLLSVTINSLLIYFQPEEAQKILSLGAALFFAVSVTFFIYPKDFTVVGAVYHHLVRQAYETGKFSHSIILSIIIFCFSLLAYQNVVGCLLVVPGALFLSMMISEINDSSETLEEGVIFVSPVESDGVVKLYLSDIQMVYPYQLCFSAIRMHDGRKIAVTEPLEELTKMMQQAAKV